MMTKLTTLQKNINWFLTSLGRSMDSQRFNCPNCKNNSSVTIDQKFFVSQLRECAICRLRFRAPIDLASDNYEYYQKSYSLGFTTDTPNRDVLDKLLSCKFAGHEKSYDKIIQLLKSFYPSGTPKLIDFGCSWGYGSWQLQQAGFSVFSYEISSPRADYAQRNLDVKLIDLNNPPTEIDIFFSNHVFEHIPEPSKIISLAKEILKPDGIFVAITPNGSDSYRNDDYRGWHSLWGKDHPNHLSDTFYENEFSNNPYFISSMLDSFDEVINWNKQNSQIKCTSNSPELLLIAYPNKNI